MTRVLRESTARRVGIISDTHGRLDDVVLDLFAGVDRIVHAGDVGGPEILAALERVAPVTAVRGNVDRDRWAWDLPLEARVEVGGRTLLVGHIRDDLLRANDPAAEGVAAVVFGHSHQPLVEWREGILFLNPGSEGNRRFHLPRAVAFLEIGDGLLRPEIVILEEGTSPSR
jgi:putative phosphoesterase